MSVFIRLTARWRISHPQMWQSSDTLQHLKEKKHNIEKTPCMHATVVEAARSDAAVNLFLPFSDEIRAAQREKWENYATNNIENRNAGMCAEKKSKRPANTLRMKDKVGF